MHANSHALAMTAFVILGVSGAGKSTIGAAVARHLQLPFVEADDFHPPENVDRMSAGIPLTDEDRIPWIDKLAAAVNGIDAKDVIIACSALTKSVRDRLRTGIERPVSFIHLTAPPELIQARLNQRPRHFMKAGMLASQLATLQTPANATVVPTDRPLPAVVDDVVQHIRAAALG